MPRVFQDIVDFSHSVRGDIDLTICIRVIDFKSYDKIKEVFLMLGDCILILRLRLCCCLFCFCHIN
ncbi:hypothetical protein C2134_03035 [Chromobacterium sinusclupearum]|uniref:Uncharacterized protein n=1 Tax=Chromobacterium sinusclupearum TaxID=2077146 RepID=A0A2K4MT82_9NEIS|nr:hypothetical protein C2134_03035 [Chromobacterium sinusclupearum]